MSSKILILSIKHTSDSYHIAQVNNILLYCVLPIKKKKREKKRGGCTKFGPPKTPRTAVRLPCTLNLVHFFSTSYTVRKKAKTHFKVFL